MKPTRRHWYHCSEAFHGDRWVARRRTPTVCDAGEPPVPRLCVGGSVAQCFAARLFTGDVFVYRTERERRSVAPFDVWDRALTGERWLVPPVAMVLTTTIPAPIVARCTATIRWHFESPGDCPMHVARLLSFRDAIRILEELDPALVSPYDAAFVDRALTFFLPATDGTSRKEALCDHRP